MDHLFNRLSSERAADAFFTCFPHTAWARRMADGRPFSDVDHLLRSAEQAWQLLHPHDWLGAIRASGQQETAVNHRLAVRYLTKFGFPFVIAPAGKRDHAAQLLERLDHSLAEESLIAAGQLKEIAREKLRSLRVE